MTNEEALKYLDSSCVISLEDVNTRRAIALAVEALEKQIPKKPIIGSKKKEIYCPCCGRPFPGSLVFLKKRCWDCGQKIDWSDVE